MTTIRVFVKIMSIPHAELFPKRPSGALLRTLSKLYDGPVGFLRPPKSGCCSISDDSYFEVENSNPTSRLYIYYINTEPAIRAGTLYSFAQKCHPEQCVREVAVSSKCIV